MRTPPLRLCCLVLTVAACKAAPRPFPVPQEAPPVPVRVTFDPPVGATVVERSDLERIFRAPDGATTRDTVEAVLHSRFEREGDGYLLTQTVPEVQVKQNGAPVENPLVELVNALPLQIQLAKDGAFVRLLNPDAAEAAVHRAFPDEAEAERVLRYFTPDAVEAQARREWNARYGELFERNLVPGSAWYVVESLDVGGGDVAYLLERRVEGTRPTEEGRELVVRLGCPPNAEAAGSPEEARDALDAAGLSEPAGVTCEGEQVVALDPFRPVSTTLEVRAGPVLLKRSVRTEAVKEPESTMEVR